MTVVDKIYAIGLFMAAVVLVIAFATAWEITQPIIRSLGGNYTEAAMDKLAPSEVNTWMDWTIIMVYFAINLVVCIVLPLYVENNPILFGIFAFIMFILIFVNAVLSNAMVSFIESFAPSFTMTIFLLENFVLLEVIFILIMMFTLFFKGRSQTAIYQ